MTQSIKLSAEIRNTSGKGAARALRREGKMPAIIYGTKGEVKVSIETKPFVVEWKKGGFKSKLIELETADKTFKVLPRDIQLHPVKESPLHADFLHVENDTRINVFVHVKFINDSKSPGIKRGGVLNVVRHQVELSCLAGNIPESIVVDLAGRQIGESIHISAIELPEGTNPTIERDFTIATIAGRAAKDEESTEDAAESDEEGKSDA